MNKIFQNIIALIPILFLLNCSTSKVTQKPKTDKQLSQFASMLIGKYSSKKQAEQDTTYFNISLIMKPIWQDRNDGIWLYIEQAVAAKPDKPYRQRVYRLLHPSSTTFTSDIYTIKNALDFAGLQNDDNKKALLTFDKIELKDGCSVTLDYENGMYQGGTLGDNCPSELRGAKYATTKITLKEGRLESWDQGFDSTGKQVWGATKGGYIFLKE